MNTSGRREAAVHNHYVTGLRKRGLSSSRRLLSALVGSTVILTGGLTPGLSRRGGAEYEADEVDDRMYG